MLWILCLMQYCVFSPGRNVTASSKICVQSMNYCLSQRFEVAAMLKDGKTYLEIAEKTGASTATISRVNRSLNYGNDGYELVFGRMEKKDVGK